MVLIVPRMADGLTFYLDVPGFKVGDYTLNPIRAELTAFTRGLVASR
jgi:hypothetical protein